MIEISGDASESIRPAKDGVKMTKREREQAIAKLEKEMMKASKRLEFELAAALRDRIIELRGQKD